MTSYKCLALTDHRKHSKENSLYALMAKLSQHPQCHRIDVASRGNSQNDAFFDEHSTTTLFVKKAKEDFVFDETGRFFLNDTQTVDLQDYDVILMRLPRPVSDDFFYFLAQTAAQKVIINHPLGILKTSTKAYLQHFPELCPPIKLCYSIAEILAFAEPFPIVLKPLKEYGGKGILKIDGTQLYEGNERYDTHEYLHSIRDYIEKEGYLAMKFLKNVSEGDKRIIVIGDTILAASLRMPPEGSWMCNVAQGGRSLPTEVSPEEVAIVERISPKLKEDGVLIYGVDTLVDDNGQRILSEINTLSIGGFPQAERQTGQPILAQTIQKIITYVEEKSAGTHSNGTHI